jgi:hypothetical protein
MTIAEKIDQYRGQYGVNPPTTWVAHRSGLTIDQAELLITSKTLSLPKSSKKIYKEEKKTTLWHDLFKKIALVVGLSADLIMAFVCFKSQAPDVISQIAFIAVGVTIVILIGITAQERAYKLWMACVIVAFFFDTSFLLESTRLQHSVLSANDDKELNQIGIDLEQAKKDLKTTEDIYNKALFDPMVTKSTQSDISNQVKSAMQYRDKKEFEQSARKALVESGVIILVPITADGIFSAIPIALTNGRVLQTVVYAMISGIIQSMIAFALGLRINFRRKR